MVREADIPAVTTEHLTHLRPTLDIEEPYMRLILAYLGSGVLDYRARSVGGLAHISIRDIADMRLPNRDDMLTEALFEIVKAGGELRQWSEEAEIIVGSVFSPHGDTDSSARRQVIEAGQLLRLRADAAGRLDDFGYTVRTRFPYPIALRWREVEARVSSEDLRPAYNAILAAAEILLAYCALSTAALARDASVELSSVTSLRTKLSSKSGGGPGLGEWVNILAEAGSARKRRGLPEEHPLHDFGQLLANLDADEARKRVARRRNDEAHERRVDDVNLPAAVQESLADLKILLEQATFLADMPLIEVTSVDWNSFRREATLSFRRLMGDHPVVPTETMINASSAVERRSLYLVGRDRSLHLLRPFLLGKVCSECRTWSTFHVDKVAGAIAMKTLEHGHLSSEVDSISLQEAGLL
ncbi:restriction endonuclease [Streptomyces viridodiastaticus]|uniref:restriction endonuclease n=1 Tax=Streptomyces albogriseolus TaxID=1887 RepID=UPI002255D672|nr:restriction endonuclease [Streptomyces viridodiastaticus]MCX4569182.1 restriction endonuclease [Streptomyces viridodiastaticus]